jgi:DNA-binding FrmR family transcriptional regulator
LSGHKRKDVSRRIARIHGHVHGIAEMLDEGRPYTEVVHQISAVRSSLDAVLQVIVDDLVEDCVARAEKKVPMADSLVELKQVVSAIR